MEIQNFTNPKAFLSAAYDLLMKDEAANNLALGIAMNLAKAEEPPAVQPLLAMVCQGGKASLVMLRTTKHLVLSGDEDKFAVAASIDFLIANKVPVTGIIGTTGLADLFAADWCRRNKCPAALKMSQRIYRLDSVNSVPKAPGKIRPAQEADMIFLPRWINEFSREALDPIPPGQARLLAERGIALQKIYLWEDGNPVSMAQKTRPTVNGVNVGLVYTPPQLRRKGYATSCVAGLSQILLNQGYKYCILYTDLANPTSNKIYMDIGYRPVADSVVYRF